MARYRVGMIGCGGKAYGHALSYRRNPATEVVAACDVDQESLDRFCEVFKVPGYTDYEEMLRKERIDIAAPILPVSANPSVVIGCAKAGVRAIGCEKPISASLAEADGMVDECRKRGIKFMAGDLDRNIHHYHDAAALIAAGAIGAVRSITVHRGSGLEISGGGCQLLSLTRLYAGDADVAWVIGWVDGDPWSDGDQGMAGYIWFTNGVEAFLSRKENARRYFEVLGSEGVLSGDGAYLRMWKTAEGKSRAPWSQASEIDADFLNVDIWHDAEEFDEEGWRINYRNANTVQSIVDALDKDIEPRANGDNGRKVLEIGIALRESHRRGHAPVQLPLIDRSLKIVPYLDRWETRRDRMGRENYWDSIMGSLRKP